MSEEQLPPAGFYLTDGVEKWWSGVGWVDIVRPSIGKPTSAQSTLASGRTGIFSAPLEIPRIAGITFVGSAQARSVIARTLPFAALGFALFEFVSAVGSSIGGIVAFAILAVLSGIAAVLVSWHANPRSWRSFSWLALAIAGAMPVLIGIILAFLSLAVAINSQHGYQGF